MRRAAVAWLGWALVAGVGCLPSGAGIDVVRDGIAGEPGGTDAPSDVDTADPSVAGDDASGDLAGLDGGDADGDVPGDSFAPDGGGCREQAHCRNDQRCLHGTCEYDPGSCGVPPDRTCHTGLDEASCRALGGTTVCTPAPCRPPDASEECLCYCPTGDAGCLCWSDQHCNGYCEFGEDGQDPYDADCLGIGRCSALRPSFGWGCRCQDGGMMCSC